MKGHGTPHGRRVPHPMAIKMRCSHLSCDLSLACTSTNTNQQCVVGAHPFMPVVILICFPTLGSLPVPFVRLLVIRRKCITNILWTRVLNLASEALLASALRTSSATRLEELMDKAGWKALHKTSTLHMREDAEASSPPRRNGRLSALAGAFSRNPAIY